MTTTFAEPANMQSVGGPGWVERKVTNCPIQLFFWFIVFLIAVSVV